ncbi:MAG: phage holin family protein [Deferribacterales bacterium]|nr:phage holin family protein [Deferribacterales bacterium]
MNYLLYFIYKSSINVIALGLAAVIFKHIQVSDFSVVVVAAIILTILNTLVKPFLLLISLPVVFLTLGLGYLIVNAIIIMITSWAVSGYYVDGFWTAIGAGLFVSFINIIFDYFSQNRRITIIRK